MAVLHENPDLQQGLLDVAADNTSAAVVAPLTFGTYFSLAGDAYIDHNEDDAQPAKHRHLNINSYFSDDEDDTSSPSGVEEVDNEARDDEEHGSNEDEPPLDSFSCLRSLTPGSSYVTKQSTPAVMSPLMRSTQSAISSGRFTIPPEKPL
jgi:hypothetical protein